MTHSILGFDPSNGDLGVAMQSNFPGLGSLVPYVEAVCRQVDGSSRSSANWFRVPALITSSGRSCSVAMPATRAWGVIPAGHRVPDYRGDVHIAGPSSIATSAPNAGASAAGRTGRPCRRRSGGS